MKNAEFKKYYNEMKDCFTDCPIKTLDECRAMENLYRTAELLTDKQDAAVAAYFAEIELNLHDAIIAKNAAVEMAKASANGGWKKGRTQKGDKHMSNKKNNKPAEAPTVKEVEKALEAKAEQPETAPAPVEVLKGEVIETKNEAEINAAIGRISTVIDTIGRGYLEIVGDVARLRKFEAWKLTGHKNLYELCADKFGMSKGTVHNLEVVFKKYGDPETFQLTDACAGMSLREMLQNIDAEKKAIAGEVAGEAADGDGNGEAPDSKKTKTQTIINVSYELAGDDWDADAILDEIRKQLEQNPDAKEAFPDGATVNFTISI